MNNPHYRSSRPSSGRAPHFRGTHDLKFSPTEQAAIRAAEHALGYERQQRAPTTHPATGLVRLLLGAVAVWLALSVLIAIGRFIGRGILSMSNIQRASFSESERGRRVASKNIPATAHPRLPQVVEPPRSSSVASQGAPVVAYVTRDGKIVALTESQSASTKHAQPMSLFNSQTEQQAPESLTILPLAGVKEADLAWPAVRVLEPSRFQRFPRRRHSLLRRALGGMGQVLEGAAQVAVVPLQAWTEGFLGQPQAFPYYAPQRAERRIYDHLRQNER